MPERRAHSRSHDRPLRLIVFDQSPERAEVLVNHLRQAGYAVRPRHVRTAVELSRSLGERLWDIVFFAAGSQLPYAHRIVRALRHFADGVPFIIVSDDPDGSPGEEALELLRAGASDIVARDNPGHLQHVVRREMESLSRGRTVRRLRMELRESEKRYVTLLASSREAVACIYDGKHVYANPPYLDLFSLSTFRQVEGRMLTDLVASDDRPAVIEALQRPAQEPHRPTELRLAGLRGGGGEFPLRLQFSSARLFGRACVQVLARGKSADQGRVNGEPESGSIAQRDPVTGVYNRTAFMSFLGDALGAAGENPVKGMLLYLEIDQFQALQGTVGIAGSDRMATEIAISLQEEVPDTSIVARFGDNAFVVLATGARTSSVEQFAHTLRASLGNRVFEIEGRSMAVSTHLGVVPLESGAPGRAAEFVERAYRACHAPPVRPAGTAAGAAEPEAAGEAESVPHVGEEPPSPARLVEDALSEGRALPVFQPIIKLQGEPLELYEVFTRVRDASGAPIPARELFTAASGAPGLMARLDRWVLERSIRLIGERHREGRATHFFVKLSEDSIRDPGTPLAIGKLLKEVRVPPERLIVEIAETSAVSEVKYARAFIQGLGAFGCPCALEHFGTGLTSFKLLQHLPVQYLKIDSSLIIGLASDPEGLDLVRAIAREAASLGKYTIAECLEDAETLSLLYQAGVDFAQGYYIQEPSELLEFDFASVLE